MSGPHSEFDAGGDPTLVRGSGEPAAGDPAPDALTPTSGDEQPSLVMLRVLGKGGMGLVRLALQTRLHREVAVKTVRSQAGDRRAALQALREEALITAKLQHPSIIPVYSVDEPPDGEPSIVMMPVEGIAWSALLKGKHPLPEEGRADPLRWHLELLAQVANALEYAHSRHILHRDLKPDNVMIGRFGAVYLLDWGVAVSLREEDRGVLPLAREALGLAGTPQYMAPEMARGQGAELSARTDVYLLGATLHEIVTGEAPHAAPSVEASIAHARLSAPAQYPASVPAGLAALCHRAMALDPNERFASAQEFRASLLAYLRHRASIQLSDEAAARVSRLATLTGGAGSAEEERVVRDLFSEARFGFQQALRDWPENPAAQQGTVAAVHLIVNHELRRKNLDAARSYLAMLEAPPADLLAAVQKLEAELAAEREAVQELKTQAHEADRGLGAAGRAVLAVFFGAGASGSLLVIDWADVSGVMPLTRTGYVSWLVVLAMCTAFSIYVFRSTLLSNQANRQIIYSTVSVIAALVATRFTVHFSELPVRVGFRIELVVYGLGFAMLGVVSNYRIFVGAAILALGAVVDAAIGTPRLYVVAASTFLAFVALAWAWALAAKKQVNLDVG